jgi:hypothetical protein
VNNPVQYAYEIRQNSGGFLFSYVIFVTIIITRTGGLYADTDWIGK